MADLQYLTELNSHVFLEDHPKYGLALWHKLTSGEYDFHIELNDRAEEKLLELLQARKEVREHQDHIREVLRLRAAGDEFSAECLQIDQQITDAELNAAVRA